MTYDNVVIEAIYKIIKTRFEYNKVFSNLEELKLELFRICEKTR